MGGSGVQRPLKFAKYLREYGWNPIILCPDPGAYQIFDKSLQKELDSLDLEIHRVDAKTPFHTLGGKQKSTGLVTGNVAKVLRSISRRAYFPDNKKGWIAPAIKKGKKLISEKKIDLIFSTAPPFSNHVIAKELSNAARIPMVTDYRDLFLNSHFEAAESQSRKEKKRKLEAEWLNSANGIVVLDSFAKKKIKESVSKDLNIKVLPHGYDPDDFRTEVSPGLDYKKGKLNWLYSGLFYESNQPDAFLEALEKVFGRSPDVKSETHLHFQGGLNSRIQKMIDQKGLSEITSDYGYVSHNIAAANLIKADVLWMISNFSENLKQIKSGKLFEYIGSQKPVFGLAHPGEAQKLLNCYKAGFAVAPSNVEKIADVILKIHMLWKENKLPVPSKEVVLLHNRKKITGDLAQFFNEIAAK